MLRRKTVVDKVFPLLTESLPERITNEMLHQYNDKAFLYDPSGHTGAAGTYYCLKCKSSGVTQLQVPKCPHCGNSKARAFRRGYGEENTKKGYRLVQSVDDGIMIRNFKCEIVENVEKGIFVHQTEHSRIFVKGQDVIAFLLQSRWLRNNGREDYWQTTKQVYDVDYEIKNYALVSEVDVDKHELLHLLKKELSGSAEKLFESLKIVVSGQTLKTEEVMPDVSFKEHNFSVLPMAENWEVTTKEEPIEGTDSFVRQHSWCAKCGKYHTKAKEISRRYYTPDTMTCIQCGRNYGREEQPKHIIDAQVLDDESVMLKITCVERNRVFDGELVIGQDPKVEVKHEVLFINYIHVKLDGTISFFDMNGKPIEKVQVLVLPHQSVSPFFYTNVAVKIIQESKAMKRTGMNALVGVYHSISPKYLEYLSQMPCLEMFAKAGMYTLVSDIISKDIHDIPAYFRKDIKGSRFSGFTKPQIQALKASDVSLKQFIVYMQVLSKDPDALYTEYTAVASASHERYVIDILRVGIPGMTVSKIKEYMERVDDAQCCGPSESMQLWADYLRMLKTAECDLTDKQLIYPNSLKREHDKMSRKVMQIQDEKLCADFAEMADENEWLEYHGKTLSAIVPHTLNELYEEGRKLSHCVGSYAKTIVKRETMIAFVRKNNNMDTPYCTVEVRGKKIVQARGFSNRPSSAMPDVSAFLSTWAKEKGLTLDVA